MQAADGGGTPANGTPANGEKNSSQQAGEQKMEEPEEEDIPAFACKVDSTEILINLLSTLLFSKDQLIVCKFVPAGMKFLVEKDSVLRAKAYIKSSCFQEYFLPEDVEEVGVTLNLSILLECLQVFGSSSHMHMSYMGEGAAVCLILEDAGVITQCEIRTLDLQGPNELEFNFRTSPIAARAVVKSQFLKDCFGEMDVAGASDITVHFTETAPFLSMAVKGDSSRVQIDFPNDKNSEVFTEFECKSDISSSFSLTLIRPVIRALVKAESTNLRVNEQGMLSMQHLVGGMSGNTWVEVGIYFCSQEPALTCMCVCVCVCVCVRVLQFLVCAQEDE